MLPGLFINKVIDLLRCNVNFIALVSILLGLLCMGLFRSHVLLVAAACWPDWVTASCNP